MHASKPGLTFSHLPSPTEHCNHPRHKPTLKVVTKHLKNIKLWLVVLFSCISTACGGGGGGGSEPVANGGVIAIAQATAHPWTIDSVLLFGDNLCQLVANGGAAERADLLASQRLDRHIEGNCVSDRQLTDLNLAVALPALGISLPAYTDVGLFLGVNDYLNNVALQSFVNAYAAAIDAIQGEGLTAHCFIQPSLSDHPDFDNYRQAAIDVCDSRGIEAVDTSALGLSADYNDGFHFTAAMHSTLADILSTAFTR